MPYRRISESTSHIPAEQNWRAFPFMWVCEGVVCRYKQERGAKRGGGGGEKGVCLVADACAREQVIHKAEGIPVGNGLGLAASTSAGR